MMKSLIRIAGLMVIVALSVGVGARMTAFADSLPLRQAYAISIADVPQQEGTPEATPEATETVNVPGTISDTVAAQRAAAEAESSSAISTLFSIMVTAIVGAVVLAAVVAGAIYVGMRLVRGKDD